MSKGGYNCQVADLNAVRKVRKGQVWLQWKMPPKMDKQGSCGGLVEF